MLCVLGIFLLQQLCLTTGSVWAGNINVNKTDCPVNFYQNSNTSCVCSSTRGVSLCKYDSTSQEWMALLVFGNCISAGYLAEHMSPNEREVAITGSCPFTLGTQITTPFIKVPQSWRNLSTFCHSLKRKGKLCSECNDSAFGIDVLSVSFNCVQCTDSAAANWLKYLTVKLLPLTLFFLFIAFIPIKITSAAFNGFILYSQIVTLPWNIAWMESLWQLYLGANSSASAVRLRTQLLVAPLSIWNLNFDWLGYIFSSNGICLGHNIRVIHVLVLEYISAVYPLLLLAITYALIKLHFHNCRPLVYLWNVCRMCVNIHWKWPSNKSFIDCFATFLLLSHTKLVYVSVSLLAESRASYRQRSNHSKGHFNTMAYDPSVELYSSYHIPYAIFAYAILLSFGILPAIILFIYPFKLFQRVLNRCRCPSLTQSLHTFADVFQGCFKNGVNRMPDRRHFSGLYFAFRMVIVTGHMLNVQRLTIIFNQLAACYLTFSVILLIFLPYKKHAFNCLDAVLLNCLLVVSITISNLYEAMSEGHTPTYPSTFLPFFLLIILMCCPVGYMVTYTCYWIIIWLKHIRCVNMLFSRKICNNEYTALLHQSTSESTSCSPLPDRLEDSQHY